MAGDDKPGAERWRGEVAAAAESPRTKVGKSCLHVASGKDLGSDRKELLKVGRCVVLFSYRKSQDD